MDDVAGVARAAVGRAHVHSRDFVVLKLSLLLKLELWNHPKKEVTKTGQNCLKKVVQFPHPQKGVPRGEPNSAEHFIMLT